MSMATDGLDLDGIYAFAIQLARTAGQEIKAASEKRWHSSVNDPDTKLNSIDLVTETDQRVERLVIDAIKEAYPSHKFVGEESYAAGRPLEVTADPTWICDPIDGTTNFIHGFPACCISIGFCVDRLPTIGVVYNPLLDQLYRACKGKGSFMNDRQLPLSHPNAPAPLKTLGEALIAVEMGSLRNKEVMQKKMRTFERLAGDPKSIEGGAMCHSLRMTGSAALNFCQVASGCVDLYWEIGCYSWDVCAGTIIAQEAGGKVYAKDGSDFTAEALSGRYYTVIRAIASTDNESCSQAQDRIAKEFHARVESWNV